MDYSEATNEFERIAIRLRVEIEDILKRSDRTENAKRDLLEIFISDNIQIFADYERAQKEDGNDGATFTR